MESAKGARPGVRGMGDEVGSGISPGGEGGSGMGGALPGTGGKAF